jgi:hypothetical protein
MFRDWHVIRLLIVFICCRDSEEATATVTEDVLVDTVVRSSGDVLSEASDAVTVMDSD